MLKDLIILNNGMKLEQLFEQQDVEYELYVDLDGVMADLESYIEKVLDRKLVTQSNGTWKDDKEIWEELRAKAEPQFDKLEQLPDAMELWEYIRKYNPNILSATGIPVERNSEMKRKWVKANLPDHNKILLVKTSKLKAQHAKPNRILIDDRTKSTVPWSEAGGIAIRHKDAKSTISKLKELGL